VKKYFSDFGAVPCSIPCPSWLFPLVALDQLSEDFILKPKKREKKAGK
jgi:hypothetical protein